MNSTFEWLRSNLILGSILALIVVDRALKLFAVTKWATSALYIKPWLVFELESNTGLAWGIGGSSNAYTKAFFILFMTIALLGISYKGLLEWCAGSTPRNEVLIFIGGLSNLIDRVQYGAVVDFIQIFIGNYRLSVFNLADVYIVVGLAFILQKAWIDGNF